MKNKVYLILIAILSLVSCQKEYQAPQSATQAMAGRWWVQVYLDLDANGTADDVNDVLAMDFSDFGQFGLVTSNTAANDADSVIIDDQELFYYMRGVVPVDLATLTFIPATVLNINPTAYLGTGETLTVVNGGIFKGAGHSKSGRAADSINIALQFSDSPGDQFILTGHRDSGQPEDQYQ